jgi:hypothetical protein
MKWSTYFGFEPAKDDYQVEYHNFGLIVLYSFMISIGAGMLLHACGVL